MGLPVVGMVGGGQLSRMTHQAAISLGLSLRVLADATHDSAALVANGVVVGEHTSLDDLRAFAEGCEVVTFDHEHVPGGLLEALEAEGLRIAPGSAALRHAQDKLVMRERLAALGVPVPPFTPVASLADVEGFAKHVGWPLVLKAATGGYDGKGVWVVRDAAEATEVLSTGLRIVAEQLVPLRRELAAVVARSPEGQGAAWPVVETVQSDGICVEVVAPAPDLSEELALQAQELALRLADELGVVGVLAVELFETADGLLVNELAMRPHNSAHWTIEGARTSQFEQHLRAVLDYPMGETGLTAPWVVMANLLGGDDGDEHLDHRLHLLFGHDPGVKVHLYGKQVKPGRKVGHVTALGDDLDVVRQRARSRRALPEDGRVAVAPVVGVVMGSDSDWPVMRAATEALEEFGVPWEARVVSAHRTPRDMLDWATAADGRGLRVVIAGAGGAAHLPGMVASMTPLPVIGVPVPLKHLDGLDSLLSIVQMPAGVPVATVSVGGARNAGLLAVRVLAASDPALLERVRTFQGELAQSARAKDAALQDELGRD